VPEPLSAASKAGDLGGTTPRESPNRPHQREADSASLSRP
jgi:hypothetical protein